MEEPIFDISYQDIKDKGYTFVDLSKPGNRAKVKAIWEFWHRASLKCCMHGKDCAQQKRHEVSRTKRKTRMKCGRLILL